MAATKRDRIRLCHPLLVTALLTVLPSSLHAQNGGFPSRTIKIVVPAPPGSNLDAIPRIIADKLATRWGQPVIIENRPGAHKTSGPRWWQRRSPMAIRCFQRRRGRS